MPGTRKPIAIITAVSLFLFIARANAIAAQALGFVTVAGSATINNSPAISGQTIFENSTITTTTSASLTLDVPRNTRIEVAEETELTVKLANTSIEAVLKSGRLSCSTLPGAATRVEIAPGLSVLSDTSLASQFTVVKQDGNFELAVLTGAVDLIDARENTKAITTHLGPGATFSNTGLTQQNNLSNGKRAGIFIAAGGALALIFLIVVSGNEPGLDGPGGCVIASGESGC